MALFSRNIRNFFSKTFKNNKSFTMSAQLRAEKALEEMKTKNPYFDKYSSKIAALQKTNPQEFINKIEQIEKKSTKKVVDEKPRDYSELLNPKSNLKIVDPAVSKDGHKSLADIMKIELLQDKTKEEIEHIWLEYHKNKDVIVATIPMDKFDIQMKNGKTYPIFIVPLPRSQGFEFFLLQFAANTVHFTPLICYQVHKENAPECLNLTYYTEFQVKGIALMRGEFDKNVINAQEAQCLVNQLQLYYIQNQRSKINLLEKFTNDAGNFKHEDVIHELENLTL